MQRPTILLLAATLTIRAQTFEVAVIHPTPPNTATGTAFNLFEGGRIRIQNEPVKLLLRVGFKLQNTQIVGGPPWLATEGYDIEAKTGFPEKPTPDQLGPMFRSLLADRFHLKFHRETREMSVYALVVAKGGPKLKSAEEGASGGIDTTVKSGVSHLTATGTSMELFAGYAANRLGTIVVDKTGLAGKYDFTLNWASDNTADASAPPLVTALKEQLGLQVEKQKHPVEVLVIDSIDRPSEN